MHNRKVVKVLTLDDFDLDSKTVFLRMDMNCPIDPQTGEILGTKRIEEAIVTLESLKDAKVVIARIETEMGRLKDDITSLNKTIRDGNGQPPLITRIAVVEEKIAEIKAEINRMETESAEERKMRWEFLIAAVPGILALLTGGML